MDTTAPWIIKNTTAKWPRGWEDIETPAFVYDTRVLLELLSHANTLRQISGCSILFSIKPFAYSDALAVMAPHLDGFSASSLFEARLASQAGHRDMSIHLTSPGIRSTDVDEIAALCDFVAFNSLTQYQMHASSVRMQSSCGLRVNPQLSFVSDERYDPCRPHSKLGVPLETLIPIVEKHPDKLKTLEGILVHSNCDSSNLTELATTIQHLHSTLGTLFQMVRWVNLGGGYLLDEAADLNPLKNTIQFLRSTYDVDVFIEPGATLVRTAGQIVSTVLDVFESEGKTIAVLDTTVNHMPEVLEYGFEPDVLNHEDDAALEYLLVGCTCLSGDVFGFYRFHDPLSVGSQVIFPNAGAYTLPKAHTFNGVNMPTIYSISNSGDLELEKQFTYSEYAAKWGQHVTNSP